MTAVIAGHEAEEIVRAWRVERAKGLPPMHALSRAMDALGIEDRRDRDEVLDSGLFDGWPPAPVMSS